MPSTDDRLVDERHHAVAPRLPAGLKPATPGTSTARVATKAGSLDLLAAGRGMELVRGTLGSGERHNMVPAEDGQAALEVCVITNGVLLAPRELGSMRLPPGSVISADGLAQPVSFTADGDVSFLY